jgi:hypothetical protein
MFAILTDQVPEWLFLLMWFAAMLGGFFLMRHGFYYVRLGQESNSWPTARGKVVRSFLHSHTSTSTNQNGLTSTSTSYSPRIQYVYEKNGVMYRSEAMTIGGGGLSFHSQTQAEFYLDNYPVGKEIDVYYNPNSPAMSVLIPGGIGYGIGFVVAGAIFLLVGLFILFVM